MHWEENDCGSKRVPALHHQDQILKRSEFGATQAEALGGQSENHAPEFLSWIAERDYDQRAGKKRIAGSGCGAGQVLLHNQDCRWENSAMQLWRIQKGK